MAERDDALKALQAQLDELRKVTTQEDYDEGARLHAKHNAPWVRGQYSHLEFAPYVFKAYPKMVYSAGYEPACLEYDQACMIPGRGTEDNGRGIAMILAQRKKDASVRIVQTAQEHAALPSGVWFETPSDAVAHIAALKQDIAVAAAHREYEDRNLGEAAKAEMHAYDDATDAFVGEIPETPIRRGPGRPRKETP